MKGELSLKLAKRLSEIVKSEFESGEMLEKVSPITKELLRFWFCEPFTDLREVNFHIGQKQSILNVIYLHEVLKVNSIYDIYNTVSPELLQDSCLFGEQNLLPSLGKESYNLPKYLVKMATGTGKTWVMHALLVWQVLNCRHEEERSGRFSCNFLIVAPGIIVYERLLDAYKGRLMSNGMERDFSTNDFMRNKELFLPESYREEMFSFLQNNTVSKDEGICRKATGGGLIALTNWHLFTSDKDKKKTKDKSGLVSDLLPTRPGIAEGNSLERLDAKYLRGTEVEFLQSLPDLVIINDEAHHIHDDDLQWQIGLNKIMSGENKQRVQIDFSATPYVVRGSGKKENKMYFPHVVSDFALSTAINEGLVKMISLDRRKELTDLEDLNYSAERDERGRFLSLSAGQRMMLKAGLTRLNILEEGFNALGKYPKMLVLCEDTEVSQAVFEFMTGVEGCGLEKEEVLRIDSDKKGEVNLDEWKKLKEKLFNIDKHRMPKVIISVLMLREGFDVNNVCVIVPLRASQSNILLEQIVGRGLRLMFREPEYRSTKTEIRKALFDKENPKAYYDILFIIEHPKFIEFWDNLKREGIGIGEVEDASPQGGSVTGDVISVNLKEDYKKYDMYIPRIVNEIEEEICLDEVDISSFEPFKTYSLQQLQKIMAKQGEEFVSHDVISRGQWGSYTVDVSLFSASSYNVYLQKLVSNVGNTSLDGKKSGRVPALQVFKGVLTGIADSYIRTRLFDCDFEPYENNNWKILLSADGYVSSHILKVLNNYIFNLQQNCVKTGGEVEKIWFSSVGKLKMRETYSFKARKTIYERFGYPTNNGGYERCFGEFLDNDAKVESFLKIDEYKHYFAKVPYMREDGMLAWYSPDFMVKTQKHIYIIETKGTASMSQANVRAKQIAATEWCERINALDEGDRMNREWKYVLLSENMFYSFRATGADIEDICERNLLNKGNIFGQLNFD